MSRYYYFVASLPTLRYEDRDSPDPAEFLKDAEDQLSRDDYNELALATIDAPIEGAEHESRNEAVRRWIGFERRLRNSLARSRAQSLGSETSQYVREETVGDAGGAALEDAVREALGHESPLSGEQIINRLRFDFAEELSVNHFFDLASLVSHYVQLQVLARRRVFNRPDGERRFAEISEKIMNEYYQENEV